MIGIKTVAAAAALTLPVLGFAPAAYAWDGCGWGYHQNAWGVCRPNVRPVYYAPRPVYGAYYAPRPVYAYGYRPYRPGFSVSFRPY